MTFTPDPKIDALIAVWVAQLTEARIALGMTQRELGEVLGRVQGTTGSLEGMRYRPNLTTLVRWADAVEWEVVLRPKVKVEENEE